MANQPNAHIFGLWEETGAPGGNPCLHGENVQTPHSHPKSELNPGPWLREAAVLTTLPLFVKGVVYALEAWELQFPQASHS